MAEHPSYGNCPYLDEGKLILAELRKDVKTLCKKLDALLEIQHDLIELRTEVAKLEERWRLVGVIAGVISSLATGIILKLI